MRSGLAATLITFIVSCANPSVAKAPDPENGFHKLSPISVEESTRFQYMNETGDDRCLARDCLCLVGLPHGVLKDKAKEFERRYSLFFKEASSSIDNVQSRQLKEFVSSLDKGSSSFTIVGYTDDCGSHGYNSKLVKNRTDEVLGILKSSGLKNIDTTIFNAEFGTGHDPAARRVDVIVHKESRITTMVDKIQADVYLIDASGSMWDGWKKWSDIAAVSFKPGSRVYLSTTMDCVRGKRLDKVSPAGGTEIWYSYWKVLELMKAGETLLIVSDFRSRVPLTKRESAMIESKVTARGVKVIAVTP